MSIKVHQPHDSFAKRMLSDIEIAKSLMKSHMPSDTVRRIDWETVELTNKSFVSEELSQFYSDVIWKCTIDNKQAYIYYSVEHQSTPDEWLPLRVLGYNVQLMEQHLKEGNKKLPIIINVLLYAGLVSPYPYSTDIFDCFEVPELAREQMFKPIDLIDLTIPPQEELLKDEIAGLVKVLLKQGIKRDYLNWIKNNREVIIRLVRAFGISSVIYILGTDDVNDPKELLDAIVQSSPEQKDIIMTAALKLQQESRLEGIQQGIQNKAKEVARNMFLKLHLDMDDVQEATGLTKEELKEILRELNK